MKSWWFTKKQNPHFLCGIVGADLRVCPEEFANPDSRRD